MQPFSVLLVDDEDLFLKALARDLRPLGATVRTTTNALEALEIVRSEKPTVVLSDICMPSMNGIALLDEIKKAEPSTAVVMISGSANAAEAVSALKHGAFDYVDKPYVDAAMLCALLTRAAQSTTSERRESQDEGFIGVSSPMRRVFAAIETVAQTEATVLIVGESGTGKELTARAIHRRSRRAQQPFIAVNCSALSETLLESELFGHERGAFTGAFSSRKGLFESAHGGTIFLDEIGHISPAVQSSLLRVLQEREVRRVGASTSVRVDVRVVAATNANLKQRVDDGSFRLDLYYRLNVVELRLPALREREGDIALLAKHLLQLYAKELHKPVTDFSGSALQTILEHPWPGNVRELENVVYRAVLMSTGETIEQLDLPRSHRIETTRSGAISIAERDEGLIVKDETYANLRRDVMEHFQRQYFATLLERSQGNLSEAARLSGIDRSNLRRMLREHGLRPLHPVGGES